MSRRRSKETQDDLFVPPKEITTKGSDEFFAVMARAKAGEFHVYRMDVLDNGKYRLHLSHDPAWQTLPARPVAQETLEKAAETPEF